MMSESVVLLCVLCTFCGVIIHKSILVKENLVSWLIVWLQEFVWVSMSKYCLGFYVKIYCRVFK